MPLEKQTLIRASPHSEGNPSQIPLLLGLETDQERVCVIVVTGCPAGYGGYGFLAAGFEGEREAESQSRKVRPGQAIPGLVSKHQSLNSTQIMEFCGSTQYISSLYDGLRKRDFRERIVIKLFQITAGRRDNTNTFR